MSKRDTSKQRPSLFMDTFDKTLIGFGILACIAFVAYAICKARAKPKRRIIAKRDLLPLLLGALGARANPDFVAGFESARRERLEAKFEAEVAKLEADACRRLTEARNRRNQDSV